MSNLLLPGVRLNVPIDTSLLFLEATDIDASSQTMIYNLVNTTFVSLAPSTLDVVSVQTDGNTTFRLDERTGELRTAGSMLAFVDGYFELLVNANNSVQPDWQAEAIVKVGKLKNYQYFIKCDHIKHGIVQSTINFSLLLKIMPIFIICAIWSHCHLLSIHNIFLMQ